MRFFPALVAFSCAVVLLAACERKVVDQAEVEKQVQERLAQEHQAQEQQALQQREAALNAREKDLKDREQQAAAEPAATPQPVETAATPANVPDAPPEGVQSFYDTLSPYGEWIELPNYGYVWQPADTVHDARWRPYANGHWAYTDYGWTWVSNEPYGWITYHYGRWMRTHQLRWVWVPGEQWAPAWVAWRYGRDYVGWAPLPPEAQFDGPAGVQQWSDAQYEMGPSDYTFVSASEFGDDRMADVALPPEQNEVVYDDSANVTSIVYQSPTVVFCYGPNYDFIRQKSHRLPPRLKVDRVGFGGRNGAFVSNGTLEITSPVIRRGANRSAPGVVRGRFSDSRVVTITPTGAPKPRTPVGVAQGLTPAPVQNGNFHRPGATLFPGNPVSGGMHFPSAMKPVDVPGAEANQPASTPFPGGPERVRKPARLNPVAPSNVESDQVVSTPNPGRPAATGMHFPSAMKPVDVPPAVLEQKQRDEQRLEQQAQAQRAVVEKAQQEQAAAQRLQHQQEAAAKVQQAAEQRAAEKAQAIQAEVPRHVELPVHPAESTSIPAGSPGSIRLH